MAALIQTRRALAALALAALILSPMARAQEGLRLAEQDIKAGLLYNFLRYTQWPQATQPSAPMIVCIWGRDPFDGRLAPMGGRTVNQRRIEIQAVRAETDLGACSLLFVNAEARADWPRLHTYLIRRSVLTVSDYDGFARAGGMLEFARVSNRIAVRVNVDAANAANLQVEDRLLRLASVVRSNPP